MSGRSIASYHYHTKVTFVCPSVMSVCDVKAGGHFIKKKFPNIMGLSYVHESPYIMGLSYVLSIMGLSYV